MKSRSEIAFTIPGKFRAKESVRACFVGSKIRWYTPKQTAQFMKVVAAMAKDVMRGAHVFLGPVEVHCEVAIKPPNSWPKWKKEAALAGRIAATVKPDIDNILKLVCDAMKGIVYADDKQAVMKSGRKRYGSVDESTIKVVFLDEDPSNCRRQCIKSPT